MENPVTHRKRSRRYYWNIIKKNKETYKKYIANTSIRVSKWRKNNPQKVKAHRLVFVALRNKTLKKKDCFCGKTKVEAHHENYSKPLKVKWLCKKHHKEADLRLKNNMR